MGFSVLVRFRKPTLPEKPYFFTSDLAKVLLIDDKQKIVEAIVINCLVKLFTNLSAWLRNSIFYGSCIYFNNASPPSGGEQNTPVGGCLGEGSALG